MSDTLTIEAIWPKYRASLKAFLHAKVADPDDVDDLLQDILIKTYQRLEEIRDSRKVKAWMFQVANNAIIDFYRTKGRAKTLSAEELWFEQDDPSVHEELATCLMPFMQALPEDEAEMLTAIDLHGQSQKDYAQEKGISYSTLKSRVQKSREKMSGLFQECCELSLDTRGNIIDFDKRDKGCKMC